MQEAVTHVPFMGITPMLLLLILLLALVSLMSATSPGVCGT